MYKYNIDKKKQQIPNSRNYMNKSTHIYRNDVYELFEKDRDKPLIDHLSGTKTWVEHTFVWTPFLQICSWEPLRNWLGNLFHGNLGSWGIRIVASPTCSGAFTMAKVPDLTG